MCLREMGKYRISAFLSVILTFLVLCKVDRIQSGADPTCNIQNANTKKVLNMKFELDTMSRTRDIKHGAGLAYGVRCRKPVEIH